MGEWAIVGGFLVVLLWQVVTKTRERRRWRRWMRTVEGPGSGWTPAQTEDFIEQYEQAEGQRWYIYQGKP